MIRVVDNCVAVQYGFQLERSQICDIEAAATLRWPVLISETIIEAGHNYMLTSLQLSSS